MNSSRACQGYVTAASPRTLSRPSRITRNRRRGQRCLSVTKILPIWCQPVTLTQCSCETAQRLEGTVGPALPCLFSETVLSWATASRPEVESCVLCFDSYYCRILWASCRPVRSHIPIPLYTTGLHLNKQRNAIAPCRHVMSCHTSYHTAVLPNMHSNHSTSHAAARINFRLMCCRLFG